jgi:hypothetical protein
MDTPSTLKLTTTNSPSHRACITASSQPPASLSHWPMDFFVHPPHQTTSHPIITNSSLTSAPSCDFSSRRLLRALQVAAVMDIQGTKHASASSTDGQRKACFAGRHHPVLVVIDATPRAPALCNQSLLFRKTTYMRASLYPGSNRVNLGSVL